MEIYPDGDASSDNIQMSYHLDGSLHTRTDQRGVVLTYSYDDARRTTLQAATTIPSGVDNTVQAIGRVYDTLGRTETISSYAGTTTGSTMLNQIKTTYGSHGRVTKSEQDHSGAVGGTEPSVQYAYDDSASSNVYEDGLRPISQTYPDGRVVFYGYDNATQGTLNDRMNRVSEIRETNASGQQLASYSRFGGGRMAVTTYPEPDVHQHADRDADGTFEIWDRFGRVLQSYWRPTTGTGNNYLTRIDYTNDTAGNRTSRNVRVDLIAGASLDERDQAYVYDGLNRLIGSDEGTANDTTGLITTQKAEQQWKLDQLGNWEEFDQDDNGNGTWDLEQSRTHNDVNEITAVGLQSGGAGSNWADPAHDAAGNMTTIPQPANPTSSYAAKWDAWNRLVSLDSGTTASYEYDGLNRRIVRTEASTTRHFYYNEAWQCLEERATEGGDAIKQFVWGAGYIDELVLRDRDANANAGDGLEERVYALSDAQYNVGVLVSDTGSVLERFAYDAYGKSMVLNADLTASGSGTSYAWEHRYTGRRLDPGSGLQLNRNRYYHPQLGRWCSRDPIGYVDGVSLYAAFFAPKGMDPSGREWIENHPDGPYYIPEPTDEGNSLMISLGGYSHLPLTGPRGLGESWAPLGGTAWGLATYDQNLVLPHDAGPKDPEWLFAGNLLNNSTTSYPIVTFNGHGDPGVFGPMNLANIRNPNHPTTLLLIALGNNGVKNIEFKACNVGKSEQFLQEVANLTGATVTGYQGTYFIWGAGPVVTTPQADRSQ